MHRDTQNVHTTSELLKHQKKLRKNISVGDHFFQQKNRKDQKKILSFLQNEYDITF